MNEQTLREFFSDLADEEIVARLKSGLTPDAQSIACSELERRGIAPPLSEETMDPEELPYLGDMVLLVGNLKPTEAHILASCLAAAGIHADPGDTNTVQTNSLWSIALGGAKVRVPVSQLEEAQEILESFRRGELSLGDDFDVGNEAE